MKDEPVDVLDENGKRTGQVLMKSEVHDKGLWHAIVHLWIYNSAGLVLMQKRAPQKKVWPNLWDVAAAGHVAAGETLEQALTKEAFEELSVRVDLAKTKKLIYYQYEHNMPEGWVNRICITSYITKMDLNVDDLTLQEDEVADVKWFAVPELEKTLIDPKEQKKFSPDIRESVTKALAVVKREMTS